jgi:Putative prokaryotic signal transducing protein
MTPSDFEQRDEGLSTHYSQLTDGELLKLALQPWALSDEAWDALEDELDRRQLEVPEPESPPPISALEKRDLVLLRRFRDIPEALLAKGRLESFGIECFLADDNMVRMDWFLSNLLGGVKLRVDAGDFTQAAKLLNEPIPEELLVEGVGEYVQPRCPQCGSLDVAFAELNKKVSYTTAWLGVPIPLVHSDWLCHTCGNRWKENSDTAE